MTPNRWGLAVAVALISSAAAAQVPLRLGYQGRLLRADGTPETGAVTFKFEIFAAASGGGALFSETQTLGLTDGYYATYIGDGAAADGGTGLPLDVFDGTERHLQLTVAGNALTPRQRITSVANAYRADQSRTLVGGPVDATSISINGTQIFNSSGQLIGAALTAGPGITVDGGTISARFGATSTDVCRGDDPRLSDSRAPNGAAGGDLSGTYPSPSVARLQGRAMAATSPTTGDVLGWSGSQWAPTTSPGGQGNWCGVAFTNGGTISGITENGLSPASFAINCGGLSPAVACPSGYTQISSCASAGLTDTVADCFFTCVHN